EARTLNEPAQQQRLSRHALDDLQALLTQELGDLYAADNAAAAIGRSLLELEAAAPIGGQLMTTVDFTIDALRDQPELARTALLILANAVNRIVGQLPPGLANAVSAAIWLHMLGEQTWLSQRVRPGGGVKHHQNIQVLGLVYYEHGFSGLKSLADA